MDKRTTKRGGFYFVDDTPYLSVTKILSVIDKSSALNYWFGRIIWEYMVKDPSYSWDEIRGKPYGENMSAKNRGSAVHEFVENWTKDGENDTTDYIRYINYINAFKQWVIDFNVDIKAHEKTVISKEYGYGGTLDILAVIGGELRIVDVKTGKDLYNEVNLQTSAYRHALEENGIPIKVTSALLLKEDGTYKYQINRDEFDAFINAQRLWVGLNRSICDKVGYSLEGQKGLFN